MTFTDTSSLLLLEFVAHQMANSSLLLIGTYRDVEVTRRLPLPQSLGTLIREQLFQSVELKGLSQHEVGQLAEATRGVLDGSLFLLSLVFAFAYMAPGEDAFWRPVVALMVAIAISLTLVVGRAISHD